MDIANINELRKGLLPLYGRHITLMSKTKTSRGQWSQRKSEVVWPGEGQAHDSISFSYPQNGVTWHADGMQGALHQLSPCVGVWVALLKIGWLYWRSPGSHRKDILKEVRHSVGSPTQQQFSLPSLLFFSNSNEAFLRKAFNNILGSKNSSGCFCCFCLLSPSNYIRLLWSLWWHPLPQHTHRHT